MSIANLSSVDASSLVLARLDTPEIPVARLTVRVAPEEEARLLLTLAAEVEHALMTQYLYAAYAVRRQHDAGELRNQSALLRRFMLKLAREEMGHLMTVQNLLRVIGAPLFRGEGTARADRGTLPFHYTLEPIGKRSLAKYITAERPAYVADPGLRDKLEHIAGIAQEANAGQPVMHIGAIYQRLEELFRAELDDRHIHDDPEELQARWDDWGYDETDRSQHHSRKVLVCPVAAPSKHTGSLRDQALTALRQVSEQGEGYPDVADCHYQRLLELYDMVTAPESRGVVYSWPVAINPTTHPPDPGRRPGAAQRHEPSTSYIESARSRAWAQLFNLRYQLLLGYTWHFLHCPGPRYEGEAASEYLGDYTPRGVLLRGAFDEMRHLRKIAMKLVTMPLRDGEGSVHAGPTFEPDALRAKAGAEPAWADHRAVIDASAVVIHALLSAETTPNPFLEDLEQADRQTAEQLDALARGRAIPGQPCAFQKVAGILEQAARGFTVPGHGNFWTGINRSEFAAVSFYGMRFLGHGADATDPDRYSSSTSLLYTAIKGPMPRYRPPVPASRQEFIRRWIDAQAPDNTPPNQIGVRHERSAIDEDETE